MSTGQRCLLWSAIQTNLCENWGTDFPVPPKVFMENSVFLHFCSPKIYRLDGFHILSRCRKEVGFKEEVEQDGLSLLQGYQYPKSQTPGSAPSAHGDGILDHVHRTFAHMMPWKMKGESSHLVKSKGKLLLVSLLSFSRSPFETGGFLERYQKILGKASNHSHLLTSFIQSARAFPDHRTYISPFNA